MVKVSVENSLDANDAESKTVATDNFGNVKDKSVVSENDGNSEPNEIEIEIANIKIPLIILFGPPSCGKTMTLIRLTRFLKDNGYTVEPDKKFRDSDDTTFQRLCNSFNDMINQQEAAKSTGSIDFILIGVSKNGKPLCQILEAPGEGFFNPEKPQKGFPSYVNKIINSPNRKIWCILVEPNWRDVVVRSKYVERVRLLKSRMRPTDKTIFVFNKIDTTPFVISPGRVNIQYARREVEDLYKGIFSPFKNENPITRFFVKWRCDFVPFQTGDYTDSSDDSTYYYQEGPREYPAKLWNAILKHIRG